VYREFVQLRGRIGKESFGRLLVRVRFCEEMVGKVDSGAVRMPLAEPKKTITLTLSQQNDLLETANNHYFKGNYKKSAKDYLLVVKSGGELDGDHYGRLAQSLYEDKDLEEAVYYYWRAVEGSPTSQLWSYNLAKALFDLNDFPGATSVYKTAILLDPSDADSLYNLGHIHQKLCQWDAALLSYEKAISADSTLY